MIPGYFSRERSTSLQTMSVAIAVSPPRGQQRVDKGVPDNRDCDYDVQAQENQQSHGSPTQLTARQRKL